MKETIQTFNDLYNAVGIEDNKEFIESIEGFEFEVIREQNSHNYGPPGTKVTLGSSTIVTTGAHRVSGRPKYVFAGLSTNTGIGGGNYIEMENLKLSGISFTPKTLNKKVQKIIKQKKKRDEEAKVLKAKYEVAKETYPNLINSESDFSIKFITLSEKLEKKKLDRDVIEETLINELQL